MSDTPPSDKPLSPEEFAALLALDSSLGQRRPSIEIEIRLRQLGLIERAGLSQLPARTAKGEEIVRLGRPPANDQSA